jgi:hypothetical protein
MIGRFIVQIIGATVVWTAKGFKGSINDEMAGPGDRGAKGTRNFIIAVIVVIALIWFLEDLSKKSSNSNSRPHSVFENTR